MKHYKTILLVATLFLSSIAAAQGPRGGRMHGEDPGEGRMLGFDLSDDQQAKVGDLRLKHLREVEPLRADLEKQRSALALEISADKYNEANARTIQNEISKIQNTIAMKGIAHKRAIRDILTPEQQKKFDARMLNRGPGPGFGGRGGAHRQRVGFNQCGDCRGCCN